MVKSIKKKREEKSVYFLDNIGESKKNIFAIIIILIPLLFFFLPFQINHIQPVGNDYLASKAQTHLWVSWMNEHLEQVLWNPNIFVGEPIYSRITPKIIHVDTLLNIASKLFYWAFWQLLIGGIGLYTLLRYKKIPWYIAVIISVTFVLLPDWQALIGEGHNSKFKAIMSLPWFWLSFSYLFDKKSWMAAGFFAFCFSWLSRTHHFQIVFYGILFLFVVYIYPTITLFFDKKYKEFGKLALKFSVALILVFMSAAQPLFTTNEYAKYSTRGGNPVKLGKDAITATEAGGVDLKYATQWSFSPNEILTFFIPRFRGGLQAEVYNGEKYSNLKGKQVPGYWGDKPFNGNYSTVGFILFMFAVIGALKYRKDKFVLSLSVFVLFSILLSFGRHFISIYELFFYYLPYFSKFRAPAMILNVTFIAILILAGYGLKSIINDYTRGDKKIIIAVFGAGILLLIIVLFMSNSYSYVTLSELRQYDSNTLQLIKDIRKSFLVSDTKTVLFLAIPAFIAVLAFINRKINKELFVILILFMSSSELFITSNRAYSAMNLQNPELLENTEFKSTPITQILQKDTTLSRAIVLGRGFTSNHYAYFYPIINGYSAIKLQLIQDIIEHNLLKGSSKSGINWNIVNMLGGKYVITPQVIPDSGLVMLAKDNNRNELLYENKDALNRAWFIQQLKKMNSEEDVVMYMNRQEFNPLLLALTSDENIKTDKTFSADGKVVVINYEPNKIEILTESDDEQFLVISDTYYPKGWKAFVDEKETKIYQVNHLIRGIKIKNGNHKIKFIFKPELYIASTHLVWVGNILTLLIIIISLIVEIKNRNLDFNN